MSRVDNFNPFTLTYAFIFSTVLSYISYDADKKNLSDDHKHLKMAIISAILMAFIFDSRVLL